MRRDGKARPWRPLPALPLLPETADCPSRNPVPGRRRPRLPGAACSAPGPPAPAWGHANEAVCGKAGASGQSSRQTARSAVPAAPRGCGR